MLPRIAPKGPVIVAILRGIDPDRAAAVGGILADAGIRAMEVPLNSPKPFQSIETLATRFGDRCMCGAGTVLDPADIARVKNAGGKLVVAPNTDAAVIAAALAAGLTVMPGFATPSEAFAAIKAGARHLKLFPAQTYGTRHLKALKAVLPDDVAVYAVGGVGADHMQDWVGNGAAGFGFGSELFRPDYSNEEIASRARRLVEAAMRTIES
jgi:2-dehydro-3-deoxyphosphogalactonate aldolase